MYNRYIPSDTQYERIFEGSFSPGQAQSRSKAQRPPPPPAKGATTPEGLIGGLLKSFHLEKLDRGDILLVLILLFLLLEREDNLEPVITLGLLLVFSLFGNEEDPSDQPSSSPTA